MSARNLTQDSRNEYKEATQLIKLTNAIGGIAFGIGIFIALLSILAVFVVNGEAKLAAGAAIFLCILIGMIGICVMAISQILKAIVETAVNTKEIYNILHNRSAMPGANTPTTPNTDL